MNNNKINGVDGPMKGLRVLDWTMYQFGPVSASMLGDMGADVIKIEALDGDIGRAVARMSSRPIGLEGDRNAYFETCNRNKRGIAVNLKTEEGREIVYKLVEHPMTGVVSAVSVFLITIFFVTSADSGSLVMDTITAGGKMDAPVQQRVFWCLLAGLASMALMLGGGMASLQALTLAVALPFAIVLLCMSAGLLKGLREELSIQG
ncbi:MAG: BCCT family transporter [Gammaproteobacteria bacterium]|nr:BCCT family transporter [Gammaproteobacteria bacterium]